VTQTPSWMTLTARAITFWIGLMLVTVGAVFIGVQWGVGVQEARYTRDGALADGLVVTKAIRRATRTGSSGSSTQYSVGYRFMVDGQRHEGSSNVPSDVWDRLRELEPVQIQYVRSDPGTNRIAGETSTTLRYVFGGVGSLIALIGLVLTVRAVGSSRTKAHILAHGQTAEAAVSSVEETNVKINRRQMWIVRYEYRDYAGQKHEGKSEYMSGDKATAWNPGDKISIRYDRDKPQMSVWLP